MSRVGFARWRSRLPSGGNRYDDELAAGLRALGVDVREYTVDGPWPVPRDTDRARLAELLTVERRWLVGNIVASAAPDLLRRAADEERHVTMLLHYFPADDPAMTADERARLATSEAEAVHAAERVVVTSPWAAREVAARYGRDDAVVAVPGVDHAELAAGSLAHGRAAQLLWLARLSAGKDPLTFIEALGRLADLPWTARLVGPDGVDPALTAQVRRTVRALSLEDRIDLAGARSGQELETVWAGTDLLVHTSRAESYGMVVGEAAARGIPAIVAAGTGAVDAQTAGASFPAGDSMALANLLRAWLTDPELAHRWRSESAAGRSGLPTWADTARTVASAMTD